MKKNETRSDADTSKRLEFTKKTKTLAFERAGGRCEECGRKLFPGDAEYDHIRTAYHGGDNSLENCACLCTGCHALKTKDHNCNASPISIPKSRRQRATTAGVKPKRQGFRGWRNFRGEVVWRGD